MSEEKENKNKKIAKMTVDEIDAAIKKSVETMNGESSLYVKHLRERKAELLAKK
ncbi:hypothetical protein JWG40_05420 [Leptospira sp. 201903074]|uniref:hypothetical protein n=1 Tax=Leptospira abararensis TaxID=2810036 RepID=UPI001964B719|nr:hypothetical protein [Leptospira abararensis]MBM9546446.1 hypothetical protein [Leptospira abararensis]